VGASWSRETINHIDSLNEVGDSCRREAKHQIENLNEMGASWGRGIRHQIGSLNEMEASWRREIENQIESLDEIIGASRERNTAKQVGGFQKLVEPLYQTAVGAREKVFANYRREFGSPLPGDPWTAAGAEEYAGDVLVDQELVSDGWTIDHNTFESLYGIPHGEAVKYTSKHLSPLKSLFFTENY
jgi:hypothetical protein